MVHSWHGIQSINSPAVCRSNWNFENVRGGDGELEGEKLKNQEENPWNSGKSNHMTNSTHL